MSSRMMCVAVLFATLPAVGCGTASNLVHTNPATGEKVPFGGVKQDVAGLQDATTGAPSFALHPRARAENHPHWAVALFCAADLPFSLVGDFVTWPYVCTYSYINRPVPVPPVVIADAPAGAPVVKPLPLPPPPMPLPVPPGGLPKADDPPPLKLPEVPPKP